MWASKEDDSEKMSRIAYALYRSKCLKFGSFKIKSGALSPYYIDLTWLLSSPQDLELIGDAVAGKIREVTVSDKIDKLASIELKGALILPSIACTLGLPSVVVRKAHKRYGLTGRIAGGTVAEGEKILFFDDVISDGKSKLEGIKPLEEMGAEVNHVLVVVDREQGGKVNIESAGYKFHALTTTSDLVKHLLQSHHITENLARSVLDYIERVK